MTLKNGFGKCSLFVLSANGWKDQNMDSSFSRQRKPSMEKTLFDVKAKYRLISRKFSGMKFFQPNLRLTNQKPRAFVSVRQSNQIALFLFVCCFCFVRAFLFQGHTKIAVSGMVWTASAQTGTSRSHTSNIVPERLVGRVWWTKSQASLLNIYFRLSGSQSPLLLIHFHYGPFTLHQSVVPDLLMWHSTFEIGTAQLHPVCMCERINPTRFSFRAGARAILYHSVNITWVTASTPRYV